MNSKTRRESFRTPWLLAAAISIAVLAPAAHAAGPKRSELYDQFIVKFKDGSAEHGNAEARQRALDAAGNRLGLHLGQVRRMAVGAHVVKSDRLLDPDAIKRLVAQLRADPRVEYAEPDVRLYPAFVPGDPNYLSDQWHYHEAIAGINAPPAWDLTTGAGQVVAVLDTGITAHPDLDANVVAGYDFITSKTTAGDGSHRDADPSDVGDFVSANQCGPGTPAETSSWHGTHVAGTIGAVSGNGAGGVGVAFGGKIQPLRVLGKCGGASSDISDAIVWASGGAVTGVPVNSTPASVINLSLSGGGSCLASTQVAINTAIANGSLVVVAAGNQDTDAANRQPASCAGVLTVGAVGRNGGRASYSNYGTTVDLVAPGGDVGDAVYSTLNAGTAGPGAPTYAGYIGTSMATPHASGVAALAQARSGNALSPTQLESLLKVTTRTQPMPCLEGCGTGLLDAHAAAMGADTPVLDITDPVDVVEGDGGTHTVTFTVNLSEAVGSDVTFDIATADGTATAGSDYVAKTSLAQVIPGGQTSKTFTVTVNEDAGFEEDEVFYANITNVTGAVTVVDDQGVADIVNDDERPITVLANNVPETDLFETTGKQRTFSLAVPAGASNLTFTMSGGTGDADLYVRHGALPTLDTYDCRPFLDGNEESCGPTASPASGTWYVMIDAFATYDDVTLVGSYIDPATLPSLTVADTKNGESDSGTRTVFFTVKLSAAQAGPVTFDIATANGTAKSGLDYVAKTLTGQVIPAGQTTKTVAVSYTGDTEVEENETFYVNVSNVVGANVTDGQGRATILNDDGHYLQIVDAGIAEGNSGTKQLNFTVLMSQASATPVTYTATTANGTSAAGSDYVASVKNETIPAGQVTHTTSVTINGDTLDEVNETLRLNIGNAVGATVYDDVALGSILNDDGSTLSIGDVVFGEGSSGTTVATFTVTLSEASAGTVSFTAATSATEGSATAGEDFTAKSLTAQSIPAGMLSKTFTVDVAADENVEANETFYVNLSAANGGATILDKQGKGTILNDDGANLRVGNATVTEGNAGTKTMTFTVSTPVASAGPITYNIATSNTTATAGSDYVASSLVGESIAAGMLSKTFAVTINGDTSVEPSETFKVTLSNASGATIYDSQGIGTITNDD